MKNPTTPNPDCDAPIVTAFIAASMVVAVALLLQTTVRPADHAATPPLLDAELAGAAEAPVPNLAQAPH